MTDRERMPPDPFEGDPRPEAGVLWVALVEAWRDGGPGLSGLDTLTEDDLRLLVLDVVENIVELLALSPAELKLLRRPEPVAAPGRGLANATPYLWACASVGDAEARRRAVGALTRPVARRLALVVFLNAAGLDVPTEDHE